MKRKYTNNLKKKSIKRITYKVTYEAILDIEVDMDKITDENYIYVMSEEMKDTATSMIQDDARLLTISDCQVETLND